ncbi:MAG: hypothetical protein IIA65_10125, partial [Planctomycetes bacterium]|nr:hypothetical protein [Planctomycetota bacterium]
CSDFPSAAIGKLLRDRIDERTCSNGDGLGPLGFVIEGITLDAIIYLVTIVISVRGESQQKLTVMAPTCHACPCVASGGVG